MKAVKNLRQSETEHYKFWCIYHQKEWGLGELMQVQLSDGTQHLACPKCVEREQLGAVKKHEIAAPALDTKVFKCCACDKPTTLLCKRQGCGLPACVDHRFSDCCAFCAANMGMC